MYPDKIVIPKEQLTICDIFSGTGHVAKHFKKKGHKIIANDMEDFSHSLIRHYIGNHEEIKISKYLEEQEEKFNLVN